MLNYCLATSGLLLAGGITPARAGAQEMARQQPFSHQPHRKLECSTCHSSTQAHGKLTISRPADCQRCHHETATSKTCANCHAPAANAGHTYLYAQTATIANRAPLPRNLPFVHERHATVECTRCHADAQTRSVAANLCASCHADHHQSVRDCTACHAQPPANVHPLAVHLSCAGSSCHKPDFIAGDPRTRQVCVSCHRDRTTHCPGERCVNCHILPPFHDARGDQ